MLSPLLNFTVTEIDEFVTVCTDSYVSSNILVLLNTESPEQFRLQTDKVIRMFMKAAEEVNANLKSDVWFNTYYRLDGIMVRAVLSCEFFYYMNVISKTKFIPFYRQITKTDLSYIKQGQAIVSIREVTHKDYYKRGLMKYGLIQKSKYLVSKGYIYHFAWVINPVSYKIFSQLGAEVLRTFDSKIKTGNITNYIMKLDMRKIALMNSKIKDKQ